MVDTDVREVLRKITFALAVILVSLALLSFVTDNPLADQLFDALFPLIFLFFAYQAVVVRSSPENPIALVAAVGLVVGAFTEWYALLTGSQGTVATVGRLVSIIGLGAYVWLFMRTKEEPEEEPIEPQNR